MSATYTQADIEEELVVRQPPLDTGTFPGHLVDDRPLPLSEKERRARGLWILRRNGFLFILAMSLCAMFAADWMGLDLMVSSMAFVDGEWLWMDWPLWQFLYDYGPLPALVLGIGSFFYTFYLLARKAPRKKLLWAIYPFSCLAIAPGILVNAVGKDQWGRPRPRDCAEFGGAQAYRAFWSPDFGVKGKSFPSGHASVGFLLCSLFMLPGNKHRRKFLVFGIIYGGLIGAARIAQGGHFLTDILASAGIVLCTCWVLAPSISWLRKERWAMIQ